MLLGLLQQKFHLVQSVAIVTSFCCVRAFLKKKCLPILPIGGWVSADGEGRRMFGASPERNTRGFFRRTEEPRGGVKAVLPVEARSTAAAASGIPSLHLHSRSR